MDVKSKFLSGVGVFFFSSRRRHTRLTCDWSSDVCSSDLPLGNISFWDLLSEIRSLQARAQPFSSRVFLLGVHILYRNQYSAKLFARPPCVTPYSHQILAHVF